MQYTVILFDLDGTLMDYEKAEKQALENTFQIIAPRENVAELVKLYRLINRELWSDFEKKLISASALKVERFSRIAGSDLLKGTSIKYTAMEMSQLYLGFLARYSYLIEGAEGILSFFHGKVLQIIISNGLSEVQYSRLQNSSLAQYLDHVFISEEVGFPKPDPRIFQHIFSHLPEADPHHSIIVGDNLTSDIKGGIDFGIDTCWFNPNKLNRNEDYIPKYEINALLELRKIIYNGS
ncbi:MAG: YjjG family noncanonical pyrimidine nucleotidase [Candidatus Cloacimonetes bacterium]|nr:YjjG family noncanonical pyrimidine nucleotidase [Candidatus Cloacimonadota bacterium]